MDTAITGLIGTILGALIAVVLTHHFTQKREKVKQLRDQTIEHEHWLRDQKQSCYHNAVKYIIRVKAIGAQTKNTNSITLPKDAPTRWYDDIAEANTWLTSLFYFCGDDYLDDIGEASTNFENLSNRLIGFRPTGQFSRTKFLDIISSDGLLDYQNFVDHLNQIESIISNTARREFKSSPRSS